MKMTKVCEMNQIMPTKACLELCRHVKALLAKMTLCLISLFLVACQAGTNLVPTPQNFVPENFVVEPKPPFISEVYPPAESIMTLSEFRERQYGHSVCVRWTATATQSNHIWLVVEPGDKDFDPVAQQRTSLLVNNQLPHSAEYTAFLLETSVIFENGEELRVGGPFYFCWGIEPVIGRNFATFQVRKTSGDIFSYSWYFDLTP